MKKKDHHKKLEYEIGLLLIEEIIRKDIDPEERRIVVDYFTRAYNVACIKDGVVDIYIVRDKELGIYFRMVEVMGFFEDAITAFKNPEKIKDESHSGSMTNYNSGYLIYSVLIRQIKETIETFNSQVKLAQLCPSNIYFFRNNRKTIDELFNFVEKSPFMTMMDGKDGMDPMEKKEKLHQAKELWKNQLEQFILMH